MKPKTKYLGRQVLKADALDAIPWRGAQGIVVTLHCEEFTSHCPVTGQPDFAKLTIQYVPDGHIVETKSLKLYLQKFRTVRQFNELLVDQIAGEFHAQIKPKRVCVTGKFGARGGISVEPCASR